MHGFFVFSVLVSIRFAEVFEIARESVCNSSAFNSPVAVAPFGHSVSSSTHLMMANPIFFGKLPIFNGKSLGYGWIFCTVATSPALRLAQTKVMVEREEREQPLDDVFQLAMAT